MEKNIHLSFEVIFNFHSLKLLPWLKAHLHLPVKYSVYCWLKINWQSIEKFSWLLFKMTDLLMCWNSIVEISTVYFMTHFGLYILTFAYSWPAWYIFPFPNHFTSSLCCDVARWPLCRQVCLVLCRWMCLRLRQSALDICHNVWLVTTVPKLAMAGTWKTLLSRRERVVVNTHFLAKSEIYGNSVVFLNAA